MKERFGWVSELSNMTIGPENIFNIVKVRVVFWRELLLPLTCILLMLMLLRVVDLVDVYTRVMFGLTTRCSDSSWICVCLVIPRWAETPEIRNYFPLNPFSLMDGWLANMNHCLIKSKLTLAALTGLRLHSQINCTAPVMNTSVLDWWMSSYLCLYWYIFQSSKKVNVIQIFCSGSCTCLTALVNISVKTQCLIVSHTQAYIQCKYNPFSWARDKSYSLF